MGTSSKDKQLFRLKITIRNNLSELLMLDTQDLSCKNYYPPLPRCHTDICEKFVPTYVCIFFSAHLKTEQHKCGTNTSGSRIV